MAVIKVECDPEVVAKGEKLIDRWFKKDGPIVQNLGKDTFRYLRQLWWSTFRKDFDYGETPTLKEFNVLEKRIGRVEKGFKKRVGKMAELFYLPEEVLKNNYHAKETYEFFTTAHHRFQGKRDDYQSVLNSIVKKLGEKARLVSLSSKGGFRNINKAHKELQKRYNKYKEIMQGEGWRKAEEYYEKNLANLAEDSQFAVFELANDVLRHPDLVESKDPKVRQKYGIFADIVTEWKSISDSLYTDLRQGLYSYVKALNHANKISNGRYDDMLQNIVRIRKNLVKRKNYFPTEVLNMFPTLRAVQDSLYERVTPGMTKSRDKGFDKLSEYVSNMADVLIDELNLSRHAFKAKYQDRARHNKDVITVMDNYIRNITMFNFAGATSNKLIEGIRNIQTMSPKEAEHQAQFYIDYLYDTHATLMGLNIRTPFWRTATRAVTAWEFASKLGMNFRGALRNATQSFQNFVYFGAKGIYDSVKYLETANVGALADAEAKKHGIYFADARELTNSLGLFPEITTSKINGKDVYTYKYDTVSRKMTEGLEKYAAFMSKPMKWVENKVNRQFTFKLAFALRHQQLSNNAGMIEKDIRAAIKKGDIKKEKGATVTDYVQNHITRLSSNFAVNSVKELHYEYSAFGKPKVMRTPAGSILGQFMTYGINFFNYQRRIASKAKDRIVAGDWGNEEAWRLYRLGTMYTFLYGVLAPLTNSDVGNLVQHDTYERLENWVDFMSEDPEKKKRAFYGKGPIIGTVGGPFVSDIITLGNVFGLYDLMSNGELDENSWLGYLAGYEDYADSRDSDRVFDAARALNTEVARQMFVMIPRAWNGAGIGALAQIEFGLFPSKKQKERKAKFAKAVGLPLPAYAEPKKKKKRKPKKKGGEILESLRKLDVSTRAYSGTEKIGTSGWLNNIVRQHKAYSADLQPLKGSLSRYNSQLLAMAKDQGYTGGFDGGSWA